MNSQPKPQMTKEMLKDFKQFIAMHPSVTAEVMESSTGTYLVLGALSNYSDKQKEQYMILLTAERKQ